MACSTLKRAVTDKSLGSSQYFCDLNQAITLFKGNKAARVSLGGQCIGDEGCAKIAAELALNYTVEELILQSCYITDEGLKHLCTALEENQTLKSLDVSWNRIFAPGALYLKEALGFNTTLTELNLSWNNIEDEGAASLVEILTGRNHVEVETEEHDNEGEDLDGEEDFVWMPPARNPKNEVLRTLHLNGNGIGTEGIKNLASIFKDNTTLTGLSIGGNKLGWYTSTAEKVIQLGLRANEDNKIEIDRISEYTAESERKSRASSFSSKSEASSKAAARREARAQRIAEKEARKAEKKRKQKEAKNMLDTVTVFAGRLSGRGLFTGFRGPARDDDSSSSEEISESSSDESSVISGTRIASQIIDEYNNIAPHRNSTRSSGTLNSSGSHSGGDKAVSCCCTM